MKTIPTHITPIFLLQRADLVDVNTTEVGEVDTFEHEGEVFHLFVDHDSICCESDYENMLQEIITRLNEEDPYCPYCTGIGCHLC